MSNLINERINELKNNEINKFMREFIKLWMKKIKK